LGADLENRVGGRKNQERKKNLVADYKPKTLLLQSAAHAVKKRHSNRHIDMSQHEPTSFIFYFYKYLNNPTPNH